MKHLKTLASLFAIGIISLFAQVQAQTPWVPAVLINEDGAFTQVFVQGVQKGIVYYKDNLRSTQIYKARVSQYSSIYIFQPEDYRKALDLYRDRKYEEALKAFEETSKRYKLFKEMDDNYSDLSTFYQLEALRNLGRYDELTKRYELFDYKKITRESMITQLEINKIWRAVKDKDWRRVNILAAEWDGKTVAVGQRAQIAYCKGLAYEELKDYSNALTNYATAMTADFTKSDVIVRNAALNSLRIFANDKGVEIAMRLWNTEDEDKRTEGYTMLTEANALARLYVRADLGSGVKLPAEYKKFLDYTSDAMKTKIEEYEKRAKED